MLNVNRKVLILINGLIWLVVGIMLCSISFKKLVPFISRTQFIWSLIFGLIFGIIKIFTVFKKVVFKNIQRILSYPEKVSIFRTQTVSGYLLVLVMISLGLFLRNTDFVPKYITAGLYIGVGVALFFSSFRFFASVKTLNQNNFK